MNMKGFKLKNRLFKIVNTSVFEAEEGELML